MIRAWIGQRLFPRVAAKPGSPKSLATLAARWLVGAAASSFLFFGGFVRRRNRALVNDILQHFGLGRPRPLALLPAIPIGEVAGDRTPVTLQHPLARDGNVSLLELLIIARIVASRRPRTIFEIGTFDGRTTLNLAGNSSAHVFTLDLPAAQADATRLPLDPSDASYIDKPLSGERFAGAPEAQRITQLFGDSATFDFAPWQGEMDLVFIDGAHSREYVISDTQRALRLLRPTGGVVLWHDYDASFDGVTEALHEIASSGLPVKRIAETSLAILETREAVS